MAEAQAGTGDRAAALRAIAAASETLDGVTGDCGHGGLLCEIALAQAAAGDNRAAFATARRIGRQPRRDALLRDICEVQCWQNNDREATVTARAIVSARGRSDALHEIASHRARCGDMAGSTRSIGLAGEAAGSITDAAARTLMLARIAAIQLDAVAD